MADVLISELMKQAAMKNAAMVEPVGRTDSPEVDQAKPRGFSKLAMGTYLAGLAPDLASTAYFMSHPGMNIKEENPMVRGLPVKWQLPVGAGLEAGGMLLAKHLLQKNHPTALNRLAMIAGGLHGGLAVNNMRLIRPTTTPTEPDQPVRWRPQKNQGPTALDR